MDRELGQASGDMVTISGSASDLLSNVGQVAVSLILF